MLASNSLSVRVTVTFLILSFILSTLSPRVAMSEPVFQTAITDEFADNRLDWEISTQNGIFSNIVDGKYVIDFTTSSNWQYWVVTPGFTNWSVAPFFDAPYQYQFEVSNVSSSDNVISVVVVFDAQQGYSIYKRFYIGQDGTWQLIKWSGTREVLAEGTLASAVNLLDGGTHTINLTVERDYYSLAVDGQTVLTTPSVDPISGTIGFGLAEGSRQNKRLYAEFDNVSISPSSPTTIAATQDESCPSLPARLVIGQFGRVVTDGASLLPVYQEVGSSQVLFYLNQGQTFTVYSESICAISLEGHKTRWYLIETRDLEFKQGWIAEANDFLYFIEPYEDPINTDNTVTTENNIAPTQEELCPSVPARLASTQLGRRIADGGGQLPVYSNPTSYVEIFYLSEGQTFTVWGDFFCTITPEGKRNRWYFIENDNFERGYVVESSDSSYLLEPVEAASTPVLQTALPTVKMMTQASAYEIPDPNTAPLHGVGEGYTYALEGRNANSRWLQIIDGFESWWVCRDDALVDESIFANVPITDTTALDCTGLLSPTPAPQTVVVDGGGITTSFNGGSCNALTFIRYYNPSYASFVPDELDAVAQLFLLSSENEQITYDQISDFNLMSQVEDASSLIQHAWSPDHSQVIFNKMSSTDGSTTFKSTIYLMNSNGSNMRELLSLDNTLIDFPAWSPDGTSIAYTTSVPIDFDNFYSTISFIDPVSGTTSELTRLENSDIGFIDWSPDGSKLLFSVMQGFGEFLGVFTINTDGSGQRLLIPDSLRAVWSPDGSQILANVGGMFGGSLSVYDVSGNMLLELPNSAALLDKFSWSPDGTSIAFSDGESVYLINPDGTNLRTVYERHTIENISSGAIVQFEFSPDNKWLLVQPIYDVIAILSLNDKSVHIVADGRTKTGADNCSQTAGYCIRFQFSSWLPCGDTAVVVIPQPTATANSPIVCDYDATLDSAIGISNHPYISAGGRYVAFIAYQDNPKLGDNNGVSDVYIYDRHTCETSWVSIGQYNYPSNRASTDTAISADGRFIVFTSKASNLIADDANSQFCIAGCSDIFVWDLQTGEASVVSLSIGNSQAMGDSSQPSTSADGQYIAFVSNASNLVIDGGDEGQSFSHYSYLPDVFVRDRTRNLTFRASITYNGEPTNNASIAPIISGDGQSVVFTSYASNIVPNNANENYMNVFLYKLKPNQSQSEPGQAVLVATLSDGTQANGMSYYPSISYDGRYIAFMSEADNLVPNVDKTCDSNSDGVFTDTCPQIYVKDIQVGDFTLVPLPQEVKDASESIAYIFSISSDGRYIEFTPATYSENFDIDQLSVIRVRIPYAPNTVVGWENYYDGAYTSIESVSTRSAEVIFINGINNEADDHEASLRMLPTYFPNKSIIGIYNRTEDIFSINFSFETTLVDTIQARNDLEQGIFGFRRSVSPNPAVDTLINYLISHHQPIIIVAHSQGAAITSAALRTVELHYAERDLSNITVYTFGGYAISFPDKPTYCHFVRRRDLVPVLAYNINEDINPNLVVDYELYYSRIIWLEPRTQNGKIVANPIFHHQFDAYISDADFSQCETTNSN